MKIEIELLTTYVSKETSIMLTKMHFIYVVGIFLDKIFQFIFVCIRNLQVSSLGNIYYQFKNNPSGVYNFVIHVELDE